MNATALLDILKVWVRLLAPFIPHMCEEIWSKIGDGNFVSLSEWPKYDQAKIDLTTELHEALIRSTIDDTHNIIRAIKITPKRICYYTSAPWKWKVYKSALQSSLRKGQITQSELMGESMKNSELKRKANEVTRFILQILNEINQMAQSKRENLFLAETLDETSVLKEAEAFLRRELNSQVEIYMEQSDQCYDPQNRAHLAKPYRPAIYVE
jgi:leucyl-tRNA synthetase